MLNRSREKTTKKALFDEGRNTSLETSSAENSSESCSKFSSISGIKSISRAISAGLQTCAPYIQLSRASITRTCLTKNKTAHVSPHTKGMHTHANIMSLSDNNRPHPPTAMLLNQKNATSCTNTFRRESSGNIKPQTNLLVSCDAGIQQRKGSPLHLGIIVLQQSTCGGKEGGNGQHHVHQRENLPQNVLEI